MRANSETVYREALPCADLPVREAVLQCLNAHARVTLACVYSGTARSGTARTVAMCRWYCCRILESGSSMNLLRPTHVFVLSRVVTSRRPRTEQLLQHSQQEAG